MRTALVLLACGNRHRAMAPAAADRWLSLIHPRPSTVLTLSDRHLAATALDRIPDRNTAHYTLKLHLWEFLPPDIDAVVYADLDVYPYTEIDVPRVLRHVDFAAVRDRWADPTVCAVADSARVPRHRYFNAGFFVASRFSSIAFTAARSLSGHLPYYDQTALNVAIYNNPSIRICYLPWEQNAMDAAGTEPGLRAVHAPHLAWPAWEDARNPPIPAPTPTLESLVADQDLSHPWCTDPIHLLELGRNAAAARVRDALDVGTFRFHSAAILAAAGAAVTTLDPTHEVSSRVATPGGRVDAMAHTSIDWMDRDVGQRYDAIFHDAEHGRQIVPELHRWWCCVRAGGFLAVHDAEQLGDWPPNNLPCLDRATRTSDCRGRQLLTCWRA